MDMQVLKNNSGLAISFVLKCCVCPYRAEFSSSDYHEGTQRATVNTKYVYAMRSIGRGAEAGRIFCALMNLPQPPTRFAPYNKRLLNAVKLVSEETMQKATQEAVLENGSNNNIAVAVDGTWQKPGFDGKMTPFPQPRGSPLRSTGVPYGFPKRIANSFSSRMRQEERKIPTAGCK
ncbi:uncharacterized protein NPIL_354631 [Nephila pilipes]|uniref:Mutator-like transposase domain-containing protein n=1 Tax=Nephila pilipes TaxID=299642 RepID=A0A8X6TNQ1_NEPPI|nr:uncharacterized protein NPIL_354631 [Nephila pilipes]